MRRLLITLTTIIVAAGSVAAKDWRGIVPMLSTRADVENLLGPPPAPPEGQYYTQNKVQSVYFLDDAEVTIIFANESYKCVPAGTVLSIHVTPKNELALSSINLDEKRLRKFDAADPPDPDLEVQGFGDEQEGIVVRTSKGKIQEIVYFATAQQRALCPSDAVTPEDL